MSLILVEKKEGLTGQYYHFTDCRSNAQRRWVPPKSYSKTDIRYTLELIGKMMENTENYTSNTLGTMSCIDDIIPSKDMLFSDFVNCVFMPRKTMVISENTRSCWQTTFNHHILPTLGSYRVGDISSRQIVDYLLLLQKLGLKKSTVNKHYTILQSVFKMLYILDVIDESPMNRVERPRTYKKDVADPTPESYSPQEIAYILKCMESEPFMYQVMFRIMCETGMRRGECCALTWDCIHFDSGTIDVVGNLCYTKDKGVYIDTPKSGRRNIVFVSPTTVDMLHQLKILNICTYDSKYVFTKRNSAEPIHPHTPTRYFAKIGKRYGIDHMHPHKLRHTFASIALTNGADAVSVAKLLGHSSVEVLFRYYVSTNLDTAKQASIVFQSAICDAQQSLE